MDRKDPRPAPTPAAAAASQAGFTLVEVMVTLVVISAGLLGTLKGLYQNLGDLNASYQRTAAVQKAAEMVERLRANRRGALAGDFDGGGGTAPRSCSDPGEGGDDKAHAQYRLCLWQRDLGNALAQGQGSVKTAEGKTLITVTWSHPRSGDGNPEEHSIEVIP
jgi:type IV pilus assembly protein PilV